jgi:hypothetical protein
VKTPEQIACEVIDAHYDIGTEWEGPNRFDEKGFTRAQAESDIDTDDVRRLIEEGIRADRAQRASASQGAPQAAEVRSLDQATSTGLERSALDPFEEASAEAAEHLVVWTIDQEARSAAEAALQVWCQVLRRGPGQPSPDSACVFVVARGGQQAVIDLSEESFAQLFDD